MVKGVLGALVVVLVHLGGLGCGGKGPASGQGGSGNIPLDGCAPTTCTAVSAQCGTISNGCGSNTECGSCTAPLVCGATLANRCGMPYGFVRKPANAYTINAIWGERADSVWAVTMGGQLLWYDGLSWQFVFGGAMPALYSIWGLPGETDIYFVGLGSQFYHLRGADVFDLGDMVPSDNRAVWAARADQVWVGGQAIGNTLGIFDLTGGPVPTVRGPDILYGVRAIWGPSADDVWIIDGEGGLLHGVNDTWTQVTSIAADPRLTGIHGTSSRDVWAVGPYGLYHWDGTSWTAEPQGENAGLFAVWAASPGEAWVVGDGGWIVHVTDTAFQGVPSGTTDPLYAVWGTSRTDVWVGGLDGVLLHYEPITGGGTPDAGRGCKEQGEECGPGECCAPYNCRRIADFTLCG
jgi:hypothetical protein